MTEAEVVTLDFHVTQVVDADWDRVDVWCPGAGPAERHRFLRGSVGPSALHTPYSLAAAQWFKNHPKPAKVWRVGDVVPKNTVIGKAWTAAPIRTKEEAQRQCAEGAGYGVLPMNVAPGSMCREDRYILWIEP